MKTSAKTLLLAALGSLGSIAALQAADMYGSVFEATGHPHTYAGHIGQGNTYGNWVDNAYAGTGSTTFMDSATLNLVEGLGGIFADFNTVYSSKYESSKAWDNGLIMSGSAADTRFCTCTAAMSRATPVSQVTVSV